MRQFEIHGLAELNAAFDALPAAAQRALYKRAMTQAMNVFRNEARARAPKKTGRLAKQISSSRNAKGTRITGKVTSRSPLSHLIEWGTKAHQIKPRLRKALKFEGRFAMFAHPGAKAKPFMRPAFDTKQREAVERFRDVAAEDFVLEVFNLPKPRRR